MPESTTTLPTSPASTASCAAAKSLSANGGPAALRAPRRAAAWVMPVRRPLQLAHRHAVDQYEFHGHGSRSCRRGPAIVEVAGLGSVGGSAGARTGHRQVELHGRPERHLDNTVHGAGERRYSLRGIRPPGRSPPSRLRRARPARLLAGPLTVAMTRAPPCLASSDRKCPTAPAPPAGRCRTDRSAAARTWSPKKLNSQASCCMVASAIPVASGTPQAGFRRTAGR